MGDQATQTKAESRVGFSSDKSAGAAARRRGRAAEVRSPRDLPNPVKRLINVLVGWGGVGATELYGRLDINQYGVKLDTFAKHIKRLRCASGLPTGGSTVGRVGAISRLFGDYLKATQEPYMIRNIVGRLAAELGVDARGEV